MDMFPKSENSQLDVMIRLLVREVGYLVICSKSVEFNLVQLMQKNDLYCVR
jgi:hypothetical protein